MVQIKRAYEPAMKKDGYRVLVDRLWPRGMTKTKLLLDDWLKELAPSNELRKKFGHDVKKWSSFRSAYKKELHDSGSQEMIKSLASIAKKKNLTLVYGAKDPEHNNALIIKGLIEKRLKV